MSIIVYLLLRYLILRKIKISFFGEGMNPSGSAGFEYDILEAVCTQCSIIYCSSINHSDSACVRGRF